MNTHTKQQQDKVFETDFIDSQKSDPPFAHLLALSHMDLKQKIPLVQIFYQNINIYNTNVKDTHTHTTNNYIILSVLVSHTFSKYSVQLQGKLAHCARETVFVYR